MKTLDPNKTILVCKDKNGKEVGRIPATAKNAQEYIKELGLSYKELKVEYEEDENPWMFAMLSCQKR